MADTAEDQVELEWHLRTVLLGDLIVKTTREVTQTSKPSIMGVIGQYMDLRKAGKEFIGRCPFHEDNTPSFSVNQEKGVFYCHGCHEGGDVITFLMKLENLSFQKSCARLGLNQHRSLAPPVSIRHTAQRIARWANQQTMAAISRLRDNDWWLGIVTRLHWDKEIVNLRCEELMLSDLAEDLQNPSHVVPLWRSHVWVENLTKAREPAIPDDFPPLTEEYRAMLTGILGS
jgi:hypothetical protein